MDEIEQPKPKNVFRNRNFTLTFLGALVSNIASLFYSFAVSFYILKITDNNAMIQGIYLAVSGSVFCIVTLFGGVISDRFNKAKIMYICDYLKGIVIIGFTLLLMFAIRSVEGQIAALFVVAVISNAIAAIFSPASSSLLPQIVEEESFQQAQSYFSILSSFQSIIGIVLAGILYSVIPTDILFLIVGVCYLLSGVSEMFIRYDGSGEKHDEKLTVKAVFADIKDGFVYLKAIKSIVVMMGCILFINFFFAPLSENFLPYFVATDIAGTDYLFHETMEPEMWNAFLTMSWGIGSLVMGIVLSSIKQREKANGMIRYSLLGTSLLLCVLVLFYALFQYGHININVLLIATTVIFLLLGGLIVLVNVPAGTAMMKIVEKDKFGKVSSVISIASQGLVPIASVLGGVALTYLGSLGLISICAGGFLLTAVVLFFAKSVRDI